MTVILQFTISVNCQIALISNIIVVTYHDYLKWWNQVVPVLTATDGVGWFPIKARDVTDRNQKELAWNNKAIKVMKSGLKSMKDEQG